MRTAIIEKHEALLAVESIPTVSKGNPFIGESPCIGRTFDAAQVLAELTGNTTRVYRLNMETMVPEDITEQMASEYLFAAEDDGEELSEGGLPAFVANSSAWEMWGAVSASVVSEYGTMNHRALGLQKAVA